PGGFGKQTAQPPAMPRRMAGALKEFPVDTDPTKPARPASVVRVDLRATAPKGGSPGIPSKTLPRGVTQRELAKTALASTSAVYSTGPKDPPVNVHVLETDPQQPNAGGAIVEQVKEGAGAGVRMTGVEVKSPDGDEFRGWKVQSPQTETFVLQ